MSHITKDVKRFTSMPITSSRYVMTVEIAVVLAQLAELIV